MLSDMAAQDEEIKSEHKRFGSFFIWKKLKKYDVTDIDPNYVTKEMFEKAPFN